MYKARGWGSPLKHLLRLLILNHSQTGVAGGYRKTNPIFSFNKKYHQCDRMRFRVRIEGLGWNRIEPLSIVGPPSISAAKPKTKQGNLHSAFFVVLVDAEPNSSIPEPRGKSMRRGIADNIACCTVALA